MHPLGVAIYPFIIDIINKIFFRLEINKIFFFIKK